LEKAAAGDFRLDRITARVQILDQTPCDGKVFWPRRRRPVRHTRIGVAGRLVFGRSFPSFFLVQTLVRRSHWLG